MGIPRREPHWSFLVRAARRKRSRGAVGTADRDPVRSAFAPTTSQSRRLPLRRSCAYTAQNANSRGGTRASSVTTSPGAAFSDWGLRQLGRIRPREPDPVPLTDRRLVVFETCSFVFISRLQRTPVGPRPARDPRGRGRRTRAGKRVRRTTCSRSWWAAAMGSIAGTFLGGSNVTIIYPERVRADVHVLRATRSSCGGGSQLLRRRRRALLL